MTEFTGRRSRNRGPIASWAQRDIGPSIVAGHLAARQNSLAESGGTP